MHLKGRLHLIIDPLIHRAQGREMPFGPKGVVRRCVGDRHMENDSWKVACAGVHHVKYHLGIFLSPH